MAFDQMGRDVDKGWITCCDERAPRKTYGNKEKLASSVSTGLSSWKPRWHVAGSGPCRHEEGSAGGLALPTFQEQLGKHRLTNQLRSLSHHQRSHLGSHTFPSGESRPAELREVNIPSFASGTWPGTEEGSTAI